MSRALLLLALVGLAAATTDVANPKTDPTKKGPKKSRTEMILVHSKHTDKWCHEHHLGSGAGSCVKLSGCSYSKAAANMFQENTKLALGPCHSSDFHSHEWCKIYGASSTKACIALSGCTWNVKKPAGSKCESAKEVVLKDTVFDCKDLSKTGEGSDYQRWAKCVEQYKGKCFVTVKNSQVTPATPYKTVPLHKNGRCPEGSVAQWKLPVRKQGDSAAKRYGCRSYYSYKPTCSKEPGKTHEFAAEQADLDGIGFDGYFCVDESGHEIADTRKTSGPLSKHDINCNTARQKHGGMQCPNAVTLTTKGGVVVVNKDRNKKDCAVHCNSDSDCTGRGWCCFNGCGYKCKKPVKPLSGCAQPPTAGKENDFWALIGVGAKEQKYSHDIEVKLGCTPGHDIIPKSGPQSILLKCKHGEWNQCTAGKPCNPNFSIKCRKECSIFSIASDEVTRPGFASSRRAAKDFYDCIKPVRERDFNIVGAGRQHGATRVLTCKPGYGAVQHDKYLKGSQKDAESLSITRTGKQTVTCKDGQWSARKIECSLCYDKYPHEYRDANGNSCAFYKSRPMKCGDAAAAVATVGTGTPKDNCRVSCRTCAAAEAKFLQRDTIKDLKGKPAEAQKKWKRVKKTITVTKTRKVPKVTKMWVMNSYPISEVCRPTADGGVKGNMRRTKEGKGPCPTGTVGMK